MYKELIKSNMDIKLKKWDNCYTFMLKYLDIFEKYYKIESNEFVELFDKDYNLKDFNNNDLIIWQDIDEEPTYCNREFIDGVLISKKYDSGLHFGVVYQDKYLIDLTYSDGFNLIRIRKIEDLKLVSENCKIYKIKYETIKQSILLGSGISSSTTI